MHRRGFLAACGAVATAGCGARWSGDRRTETYGVPEDWRVERDGAAVSGAGAARSTATPVPTETPVAAIETRYPLGKLYDGDGPFTVAATELSLQGAIFLGYGSRRAEAPDGTDFAVVDVRMRNRTEEPATLAGHTWMVAVEGTRYPAAPCIELDTVCVDPDRALKGYSQPYVRSWIELAPGEEELLWFLSAVPEDTAPADVEVAYATDGAYRAAWRVEPASETDTDPGTASQLTR